MQLYHNTAPHKVSYGQAAYEPREGWEWGEVGGYATTVWGGSVPVSEKKGFIK